MTGAGAGGGNRRPGRATAILLLLLTATLWSTGGALIKSNDASWLSIAFYRSLAAALVLLPFLERRQIVFEWRLLAAALPYTGMLASFVYATKATLAANAIVLQYTAPIWVLLIDRFILRHLAPRGRLLAVVLAATGLALFFAETGRVPGNTLPGNLVAVFSGLCYGLAAISFRGLRHLAPVFIVVFFNLFACLALLPAMAVNGFGINEEQLALAVGQGAGQIALPYIIFAYAMQRARPLEATLITLVEPLLNPLLVFGLTGEQPGLLGLAGGVFVLAAVVVTATAGNGGAGETAVRSGTAPPPDP